MTDIVAIPVSLQLQELLAACGLPSSDLVSSKPLFYGLKQGGTLVGAIGLELFAPCGLLRSMAVAPSRRHTGLGNLLLGFAEKQAIAAGIDTLYLLTTTAVPYFLRRGYAMAERDTAPTSIQATAQFAGMCPASATFMRKQLSSGLNLGCS